MLVLVQAQRISVTIADLVEIMERSIIYACIERNVFVPRTAQQSQINAGENPIPGIFPIYMNECCQRHAILEFYKIFCNISLKL